MAIGVAQEMKNRFKDKIKVNIYTQNSPEAFGLAIKKAASIFVNGKSVPLKIAISEEKMGAYLKEQLQN